MWIISGVYLFGISEVMKGDTILMCDQNTSFTMAQIIKALDFSAAVTLINA